MVLDDTRWGVVLVFALLAMISVHRWIAPLVAAMTFAWPMVYSFRRAPSSLACGI
jgi:hypothetical protein